MPVSLSTAETLKATATFVSVDSPSGVAWADRGVESEIISPLYEEAAALVEAARQAGFLAGPLVEDVASVSGLRRDLMGKVITIKIAKLGYDAGLAALVIGYSELEASTELQIVRSLA